jgi:hypothetical protein
MSSEVRGHTNRTDTDTPLRGVRCPGVPDEFIGYFYLFEHCGNERVAISVVGQALWLSWIRARDMGSETINKLENHITSA